MGWKVCQSLHHCLRVTGTSLFTGLPGQSLWASLSSDRVSEGPFLDLYHCLPLPRSVLVLGAPLVMSGDPPFSTPTLLFILGQNMGSLAFLTSPEVLLCPHPCPNNFLPFFQPLPPSPFRAEAPARHGSFLWSHKLLNLLLCLATSCAKRIICLKKSGGKGFQNRKSSHFKLVQCQKKPQWGVVLWVGQFSQLDLGRFVSHPLGS